MVLCKKGNKFYHVRPQTCVTEEGVITVDLNELSILLCLLVERQPLKFKQSKNDASMF